MKQMSARASNETYC